MPDGELVVLVGPLRLRKIDRPLRIIAGLETPTTGEVFIDGRRVTELQPAERDVAMVFQSYALYPHMTVYENLAFALRLRKTPKDELDRRVREAARALAIEEFLARKPKQLSGGQRQRVAIGRAVVRDPKVFLFDEPLSNLDAQLRAEMRREIARIHQRSRATAVYVTHDQTEAMTLADRLVVMKDGVVQQVGTLPRSLDPVRASGEPVRRRVPGLAGDELPARAPVPERRRTEGAAARLADARRHARGCRARRHRPRRAAARSARSDRPGRRPRSPRTSTCAS